MSDLTNTNRLFIESVNEENKKKDDLSDSIFQLNSKKNLISIAKETLKARNNKNNQIKITKPAMKTKQPEASKKIKFKSTKKKIKEKENLKYNSIFSEKEYLNFMLNDLKSITSTIEKRQKRFNPTFSNNLLFRKNNNISNYISYDNKLRKNQNFNYKKTNNFRNHNYKKINLLNQIIGVQDEDESNYVSRVTLTEDNMDFDNLYFDKKANEIFYKENRNNLI